MQTGFKAARINVKNFRYVDDTTLMAETKEELKSLLTKAKEESEEVGLKLYIRKTEMASFPITSWQIDGKTVEMVADIFWGERGGGSNVTEDSDYSHEIKRCLLFLNSIKQDQRLDCG